MSLGSTVGTGTGWTTEESKFESWKGQEFSSSYPDQIWGVKRSGREAKLTAPLQVVARSRNHKSMHQLSHMPSYSSA
jgi:hypothetical protein